MEYRRIPVFGNIKALCPFLVLFRNPSVVIVTRNIFRKGSAYLFRTVFLNNRCSSLFQVISVQLIIAIWNCLVNISRYVHRLFGCRLWNRSFIRKRLGGLFLALWIAFLDPCNSRFVLFLISLVNGNCGNSAFFKTAEFYTVLIKLFCNVQSVTGFEFCNIFKLTLFS